jgi:MerR family transcriptional regulator, Zn(II)-responsive regulator of zntA
MAEKFIGVVARECGMNPRTLRFYEAVGLLPRPSRSESGYRIYDEDAAQRLAFIGKAKSLGLSLREIRHILALRDSGRLSCHSVQRILKAHIIRVDEQTARLQAFKSDLQAMLANCRRRRESGTKITTQKAMCRVIETLGNGRNGRIENGGDRAWLKSSRFAPPATPARRLKSMTAR